MNNRKIVGVSFDWVKNNEKNIPEYWVHLRPTTPLRDPEIVDSAIEEIVKRDEATSLRSGHKAAESPFKWFKKGENGFFEPIIKGLTSDKANDPRQGFPDAYIPDGYVDVLKSSFILKNNILHGNKMIGFVSPFCTEVDSSEDFEYLEYQIKKHGSPVYKHLIKNFSNEN